jgi:hypothetical protein
VALQVFREYGWHVDIQGTQRPVMFGVAADAVRNNYDVVPRPAAMAA